MKVPFVDLTAQYHAIASKVEPIMHSLIERGDFILGNDVAMLEAEFAAFCGVRFAVGVDSGLAALELSLRAFGIGQGDEVIVPANSFIATAAAVTFAGAKPVLVDVDPASYNIDPAQVHAAITPRTRAIIPVHLYGLPADMDAILDIAEKHHLLVIEDACQAHGARYKGKRVGSLGHAAAFSFYPAKNLGAFGDAGMMVTNDAQVAERIRAMRNCGQTRKYFHELAPFNHRLDNLQAAVLLVKLAYLDKWNESRRQMAALYNKLLKYSDITLPVESAGCSHVYHLYVIRLLHRDMMQKHLQEQNISTGIHYPIPIHLQPFYANAGFKRGQFPITERLADEILSIPMYPHLTREQVEYVAQQIVQSTVSTTTAP